MMMMTMMVITDCKYFEEQNEIGKLTFQLMFQVGTNKW